MAATGDDTVALVGEFWRSRGAPAVESIEWVGQTDTIATALVVSPEEAHQPGAEDTCQKSWRDLK
ncbi:MAG: hypothetical protein EBE86_026175 [Hormoscilla sp. GUM202]|nr:hypothetical protein [Hormoscilla sp. GUM202]